MSSEDIGSADVDPDWHDFAEMEYEIAEDEPAHPHLLVLRWEELTAVVDRMAAELLPDPIAGHRWHHDSVRGWRLDTGRWCNSWRDGDNDFPSEEMAAFRSMLGLPA